MKKGEQLTVRIRAIPLWRGVLDGFEDIESEQQIEMRVKRLSADARFGCEFGFGILSSREGIHQRIEDVSHALVSDEDSPPARIFVSEFVHRGIVAG